MIYCNRAVRLKFAVLRHGGNRHNAIFQPTNNALLNGGNRTVAGIPIHRLIRCVRGDHARRQGTGSFVRLRKINGCS